MNKLGKNSSLLLVMLIAISAVGSVLPVSARPKAKLSVEITGIVYNQLAPGEIRWCIEIENIGDITFNEINIYSSRYGFRGTLTDFAPGDTVYSFPLESNLPAGKYLHIYTVVGEYAMGSFVIESDKTTCKISAK